MPISHKEILDALRKDPRAHNPARFALGAACVVMLPEILDEKLLTARMTLRDFMIIQERLLQLLVDEGIARGFKYAVRQHFEIAALSIEIIGDETYVRLEQSGRDVEIILDEIGLNEELKELYLAGRLTFADVVRQQPGIFIPWPPDEAME